jgi:TetR/AcrR family transcriptional repressor of nem operon
MAKGEQTRQRIIAEAVAIFNTHGYAGTSMADLLQATGLEKGGIYNHFSSKEALAVASFEHAIEQIGLRLLAAIEPQHHAVAQLLAIAGVFEQYVEDPPVPGGCPVVNTAIEADDGNPVLRAHAQKAMTDWHRLIGKIIKGGVARGELRSDTNPYEVASIMTSLLEGAQILSRLYGDPSHLKRAVAHLADYLQRFTSEPREGTDAATTSE